MDISSAFMTAAGIGSSNSTTTSAASLGNNYETFLQLLMTQLKNQDPSSPLDTNQFTQQLIQYSQVEQQIEQNKSLQTLVQLASANAAVAMVGYVGKEVTIDGSSATLSGGKASWQLSLPEAATVTAVIKDADGNEVYSSQQAYSAGSNTFSWNGVTSSGSTLTSGKYTLSLTATNASGKTVTPTVGFTGLVQGVDMTGSTPKLLIGGSEYDVSDVTSIRVAS
jgi:flagellar basal-body rod modification protein FlgD